MKMETVAQTHSIVALRIVKSWDRGFTLMEALISICLVSVGMMGILTTFTTSLTVQKDTDDRAKALFIAQQVLEETANIDYEDLATGYNLDYYDDEISGYLIVTREVQDMQDEEIENLWTRFPVPDPSSDYKLVTVRVYWGGEGPTGEMENVVLNWIRVRRENTVEFSERVSGQAP